MALDVHTMATLGNTEKAGIVISSKIQGRMIPVEPAESSETLS